MQVSKNVLNLPPYLSTPWKNVASLAVKSGNLIVTLTSGQTVSVPNLDPASIKLIFETHAAYLNSRPAESTPVMGFKIPIGIDGALSNLGNMMQHNPDQMHAAHLPKEVLSKIGEMAKSMGMDLAAFPNPEPHCNCPHCQMARAIHQEENTSPQAAEEEISEEDLCFRDWEIKQTGEKLHRVTNPLNPEEHFDVFLGSPVGCTCGERDCEHIKAVLRS